MEKQGVNLDVTPFVERLIAVNKKASDYEYEMEYEAPTEDALKEILNILDQKIGQWEWELRYDISKRGQKQKHEKGVTNDFVGVKFI